ncbi:hypothetical protein ACIQCF_33440 [Streptomyces sp. NPDC088353]|uniref:hypothetical protein n=1 Tax=Streptomyces sp. NPDC088353 TaxID=3365855 RepID=UPI0037F98B81
MNEARERYGAEQRSRLATIGGTHPDPWMPPHQTRVPTEISDADLHNVSGGLEVGGSGGLCIETPIAAVTSDVLAIATPEGVATGTAVHTAAH